MMTPRLTVTATEATESTIHSASATVGHAPPHAGHTTKMTISTSVANPMGTVPRNSEFLGSCTITCQISGYSP
jgi:hypothetical protein